MKRKGKTNGRKGQQLGAQGDQLKVRVKKHRKRKPAAGRKGYERGKGQKNNQSSGPQAATGPSAQHPAPVEAQPWVGGQNFLSINPGLPQAMTVGPSQQLYAANYDFLDIASISQIVDERPKRDRDWRRCSDAGTGEIAEAQQLIGEEGPEGAVQAAHNPRLQESFEPQNEPSTTRKQSAGPAMPSGLKPRYLVNDASRIQARFAVANLEALHAQLQPQGMAHEVALLSRMLFIMRNAHRTTQSYRHSQEVHKRFAGILTIRPTAIMLEFLDLFQWTDQQTQEVPRGEAGVYLLRRLLTTSRLAASAAHASFKAGSHISAHIARGHFLAKQTLLFATIARLWVFALHICVEASGTFNALLPLVCSLPFAKEADAWTGGMDLPQSVSLQWDRTLPTVLEKAFNAGDGVLQRGRAVFPEGPLNTVPKTAEEIASAEADRAVRAAEAVLPSSLKGKADKRRRKAERVFSKTPLPDPDARNPLPAPELTELPPPPPPPPPPLAMRSGQAGFSQPAVREDFRAHESSLNATPLSGAAQLDQEMAAKLQRLREKQARQPGASGSLGSRTRMTQTAVAVGKPPQGHALECINQGSASLSIEEPSATFKQEVGVFEQGKASPKAKILQLRERKRKKAKAKKEAAASADDKIVPLWLKDFMLS